MRLHLVGLPINCQRMPRHRWTPEEARAHGEVGRRKPRRTRGQTWDEIYSDPAFVEEKRERAREVGRRPKSAATRAKVSATKRAKLASGETVPSFTGRAHSDESKRKISEARRRRDGDRPSLNRYIRGTSRYKQWRSAIFERDGYKCQTCGASSRRDRRAVWLEAHHKVELRLLLEGMTLEAAMTDGFIWDSANALTLCRSCHRKVPRTKKAA